MKDSLLALYQPLHAVSILNPALVIYVEPGKGCYIKNSYYNHHGKICDHVAPSFFPLAGILLFRERKMCDSSLSCARWFGNPISSQSKYISLLHFTFFFLGGGRGVLLSFLLLIRDGTRKCITFLYNKKKNQSTVLTSIFYKQISVQNGWSRKGPQLMMGYDPYLYSIVKRMKVRWKSPCLLSVVIIQWRLTIFWRWLL